MENRHEIHPVSRELTLTVLFNGAATILSAITLLRIPSDAKNAFLLGMSRERLLMAAAFVVLLGLNLLSYFRKDTIYQLFSQPAARRVISGAVWVSLFFLLMPAYRFGRLAAYYTRLQPFILWSFLTCLSWDLCLRYCRDRFAALRETLGRLKQHKLAILLCGLAICLAVLFIEITGIGKTQENALWNKNGIPLTSMQLYFAVLAAVLFRKINLSPIASRKKRILHFFLIWLCAAVIWNLAPMSPHFFAPGPYEPENSYYPYSDASIYDTAAQEALHGWGFNFHVSILKPVVSMVSYITHALCGNDYNIAMRLQSALYGVLPAILYLFGCEIGGTGCGFLAAGFSLLKEWNALNSHTVLTITSRLTMSEFLMQILFASFCLAVFRWLKKDGREVLHAAAAGGFLILGVFTRYNFLAFLPAALLLVIIRFWKTPLKLFITLCAFSMVFCVTPIPFFETDHYIKPELKRTINQVLFSQRFQAAEDTAASTENTEPGGEPEAAESSTALTDGSSKISETQNAAENQEDTFNTSQITLDKKNDNSNKYLPLIFSIFNHSFHNWIGSVLSLPMQLSFDDLEHLYQNEEGKLWWDDWKGSFTSKQWGLLIGWMIAGAIALGFLAAQEQLAGFSIPYFWMVYSFSIGFSRSSGGRYLVPCNWIPMLLLAYLLTLLLNRCKLPPVQNKAIPSAARLILPFAGIAGCFVSVFLLFKAFDQQTPALRIDTRQSDLEIMRERLADQPGAENIDWEKVQKQQEAGELQTRHGLVLYPRFYYYRIGEHNYEGATGWKDYSRMTFFGLNDDGIGWDGILRRDFILPHRTLPEAFPQDSVFHLISCKTENGYEDVLAVTLDTPEGETYTYMRDPLPDFSCPVAEPRCISIDQCE